MTTDQPEPAPHPAIERCAELSRQVRETLVARPASSPEDAQLFQRVAEWIESSVARADARADAIWVHVEGLRSLVDEQEARIRTLMEEARFADARLRQAMSELRALKREQEMAGAATRPLDNRRFEELLRQLSQAIPKLDSCGAIEVSLQSAADEGLIAVAAHVLGTRLSVLGPQYRAPNDAWIHVDFTPYRTRAGLLENAAARLAAGGVLLIVTRAPIEGFASHPRLSRRPNVSLGQDLGGAPLEAAVWERQ